MAKMYRVNTGFFHMTGIKEVNAERVTDKCVYVDGKRENKISNHAIYFDDFEPAKAYALKMQNQNVLRAKEALKVAEGSLDKIKYATVDNCKCDD